MKRDVLPSKFKIEKRTVYRKNKEGKFSTPSERLFVYSESAPQYGQFKKFKGKDSKRQLKIRHSYDIIVCIQPTSSGQYSFWDSKVIWRVGSQKKVPKTIPQNKVKCVHSDTRRRIEKKFSKLPKKERIVAMKKEFDKIRKNGKYINDSDYIASEYHIMLDFYYRDAFVMKAFDCLYGRLWWDKPTEGILMPYADKHFLMCIEQLLRRGIIKYKST